MTHNDPTRPEFGYMPADSDFFRAFEASERAERLRNGDARWLADRSIEVPAYPLLAAAAEEYRRVAAADEYARAVYEVEAAKVRAR